MIKAEWSLAFYLTGAASTYSPETLVRVVEQLQKIYRDVLGLSVYAVFTQGTNEYYEERGLHTSDTGNHVCLNSLGVPFAELLAIDQAVSEAIKSGELAPHDLYMEDTFLHSLSMKLGFKRENLANVVGGRTRSCRDRNSAIGYRAGSRRGERPLAYWRHDPVANVVQGRLRTCKW